MREKENKNMRAGFKTALLIAVSLGAMACGRQAVEPGQRGLRYDPHNGGVKPEVLQPGLHSLGWCFMRDCGYVETYDITYQTKKESVFTPSSEGLAMDVKVVVMFRPVTSELYQLHTEIGKDYYEVVVGPEFRSAARNVLARHSYTTLVGQLEKIEDEIEAEVRRRTLGKHIEVASITIEQVKYASPEIASAVEKRLIGQQEAARQKAAIEAQAAREKMQLELAAAQAKLKSETEATQAKLQGELAAEKAKRESELAAEKARLEAQLALERARTQRQVVSEQLAIDKLEAQQKVIRAKAAADERELLASATAAEKRAEAASYTPLTVQAAGFEALGKLGGNGTTIFLGDWSRAPQFLWPRGYQTMPPMGAPMAPPMKPAGYQPAALPAPGKLTMNPVQ
jgi:regulator of protease activity HflC (stomatin/prohibitin superfamily)